LNYESVISFINSNIGDLIENIVNNISVLYCNVPSVAEITGCKVVDRMRTFFMA